MNEYIAEVECDCGFADEADVVVVDERWLWTCPECGLEHEEDRS